MKKFTPTGTRVIVKNNLKKELKPSPILMPDGTPVQIQVEAELEDGYVVIDVGPGRYLEGTGELIPPCVKIGDIVYFVPRYKLDCLYGDDDIPKNKWIMIGHDSAIICTIEEDDADVED